MTQLGVDDLAHMFESDPSSFTEVTKENISELDSGTDIIVITSNKVSSYYDGYLRLSGVKGETPIVSTLHQQYLGNRARVYIGSFPSVMLAGEEAIYLHDGAQVTVKVLEAVGTEACIVFTHNSKKTLKLVDINELTRTDGKPILDFRKKQSITTNKSFKQIEEELEI